MVLNMSRESDCSETVWWANKDFLDQEMQRQLALTDRPKNIDKNEKKESTKTLEAEIKNSSLSARVITGDNRETTAGNPAS